MVNVSFISGVLDNYFISRLNDLLLFAQKRASPVSPGLASTPDWLVPYRRAISARVGTTFQKSCIGIDPDRLGMAQIVIPVILDLDRLSAMDKFARDLGSNAGLQ